MKHQSHKAAAAQEYGGLARDRGVWLQCAIAAVVYLLFACSIALGQQRPSEYQVEAAYLYNFGRFVEWPAKDTTPRITSFTICVLGEDPFGQALDTTLAGETIGNQRVTARRISSPQMAVDCQILFISSSEAHRLNKIIEALDKNAVLTVSDIPQFSKHQGMIQFVSEENRIRFEVNLTAAQRAGLTLSSELLKVATVVRKNPQPGD
ncbi:MAG: YfiR family protein [Candidatus Sulfotelmatobacter sp.]